MPGRRLEAAKATVPKFAVAGKYARPNQDQFVVHVSLVRDECELAFGHAAEVWHCAPPIISGAQTSAGAGGSFDRTEVHAVSFLDDLSPDDVAGIENTLAEIESQTQPVRTQAAGFLRQYVVHPPVQQISDKKTGRTRFRKFSCVGFILECYERGADIRLLDLESPSFPAVDLETLASAYDDRIRHDRLREAFGISGAEPWKVALAGYVMHALNRPAAAVRSSAHVPNGIAEAEFPLQPTPVGNQFPAAVTETEPTAKKGDSAKERVD